MQKNEELTLEEKKEFEKVNKFMQEFVKECKEKLDIDVKFDRVYKSSDESFYYYIIANIPYDDKDPEDDNYDGRCDAVSEWFERYEYIHQEEKKDFPKEILISLIFNKDYNPALERNVVEKITYKTIHLA